MRTQEEELKKLASERRTKIVNDGYFQKFKVQSAEINKWIEEKKVINLFSPSKPECHFPHLIFFSFYQEYLNQPMDVIDCVNAARSQIQSLEAFNSEFRAHEKQFSDVDEIGKKCIEVGHPEAENVKTSLDSIAADKLLLQELSKKRASLLGLFQFFFLFLSESFICAIIP